MNFKKQLKQLTYNYVRQACIEASYLHRLDDTIECDDFQQFTLYMARGEESLTWDVGFYDDYVFITADRGVEFYCNYDELRLSYAELKSLNYSELRSKLEVLTY